MVEKEQKLDSDRNPLFRLDRVRSSKLLEGVEAFISKVWFIHREHSPELSPDTTEAVDSYIAAEAEFDRRLEELQQAGEMRRASQITSEYEQEEHFDQLARLYRQVCWGMGLEWPPPSRKLDDEELSGDLDCEAEWWD